VADDPDAPKGVFTHWVLYNLPADRRRLPEHFPRKPALEDGTRQGINDFGRIGYAGPAPPPGKVHHYHFRIYALNASLRVPPGGTKEDVLASMQQHVLDQGELIGLYHAEPQWGE
jgi:Raf kinase inhibitor-like YbhB/YbcL family protein